MAIDLKPIFFRIVVTVLITRFFVAFIKSLSIIHYEFVTHPIQLIKYCFSLRGEINTMNLKEMDHEF